MTIHLVFVAIGDGGLDVDPLLRRPDALDQLGFGLAGRVVVKGSEEKDRKTLFETEGRDLSTAAMR